MIIAIDGPAGSGKGTISKLIAKRLNCVYIDTGSLYRCLTYKVLKEHIDISSEELIANALKEANLEITKDNRNLLDGEDITDYIRTEEINKIISFISSYPSVREQMRIKQRSFARNNNVVIEGRDVTTEVFPDADYKFYLDASIEERTNRRVKQNKELGLESNYEEIYESIKKRDYSDMTREFGALKRTPKQIYIDSSNMTTEEVVNYMLEVIK